MKSLLAFSLVVLASQAHVCLATTPGCETSVFVLEGKYLEKMENAMAQSATAFQGEVVAVDPVIVSAADAVLPIIASPFEVADQKITLRVLHQWKGPYSTGDTVRFTVTVVQACGGKGCVFPFKIGDATLVLLSPISVPGSFDGCWIHEGVVINRVLWIPADLISQSRH